MGAMKIGEKHSNFLAPVQIQKQICEFGHFLSCFF